MVGAELAGNFKARAVLRGARHDDEGRAGLLADHGLRQALLPRPLDEHGRVVAHAAVEERPFDSVRHRRHEARELRAHPRGDMVHDGVPRQVDVLREAAPQMRGPARGGVAVADGIRVVAPVGVLAMTVLAEVAPLALAARDVVLDEDEVAFLESLAAREFAPRLGDVADVLVAHDHGLARRRCLVELHAGAAAAGDFHLHQRRVLGNVRHRKFLELGLARARANGRQYLFQLVVPFLSARSIRSSSLARASPSHRRLRHAFLRLQSFAGASLNGMPEGNTTATERTFMWAGSRPGGVAPFAASSFAARIRRWRAMMMPLSVETRFSLVRSTIGPISSWMLESCIAKPATPL